jgi:phage terminase Nu1 subunit (DNA packaging protein)
VNLSEGVRQKDFAQLIGVSEATVSGLIDRGVIQRGDTAAQWLLDYCEHLREVAAGRASAGELNLVQERARLAKEQADERAMKNAVLRNEYAPYELLTLAAANAGSQIAQILDALPGVLKRRCPHLQPHDLELIQAEVVKARNAAAGISIKLDDYESDDATASGVDARPDDARGAATPAIEQMG